MEDPWMSRGPKIYSLGIDDTKGCECLSDQEGLETAFGLKGVKAKGALKATMAQRLGPLALRDMCLV